MNPGELSPAQLRRDPLPLRGRAALVTGVSRRAGIGYATARRLAALGASLFLHHYTPHDRDQPWGADPDGIQAVIDGVSSALAADGTRVHDTELDLAAPRAPEQLITAAAGRFGTWTSLSATTPSAAATALSALSTPPCSTRTGPSTPARPSCWPRPSPPGTTAARAAGSSS